MFTLTFRQAGIFSTPGLDNPRRASLAFIGAKYEGKFIHRNVDNYPSAHRTSLCCDTTHIYNFIFFQSNVLCAD
jgi:hypothetical protein